MDSRIIISLVVLTVLFISCKKESVPNPENADLKGCWDQITPEYYLDGEGLCFDGQETLFYARFASRAIRFDTLIYRLDMKVDRLYLRSLASPGSIESSHKILLNDKKDELSIWGLYYSVSGSPLEEKFKKH